MPYLPLESPGLIFLKVVDLYALRDVSGVVNTRLEITVCFHLFSVALIVFSDQTQRRGRQAWYIMQRSQGRNTGGNHDRRLLTGSLSHTVQALMASVATFVVGQTLYSPINP